MKERALTFASAMAVSAGLSCSAMGDVLYSLDDGRGSVRISPNFPSYRVLWGNYFEEQPAGGAITRISVAFGNHPVGSNVDLIVFEDPDNDGNPDNAVPVRIFPGLSGVSSQTEFTHYDIPQTPISGGFFIAASVTGVLGNSAPRVDADQIATAHRSFLYIGSVTDATIPLDYNNLGAAPIRIRMDQNAVRGVFMVRAVGVPGPGAWVIAGFGVMAGARRRRVS